MTGRDLTPLLRTHLAYPDVQWNFSQLQYLAVEAARTLDIRDQERHVIEFANIPAFSNIVLDRHGRRFDPATAFGAFQSA